MMMTKRGVKALAITASIQGPIDVRPSVPTKTIGAIRALESNRGKMDCSNHCNCGGAHCGNCGSAPSSVDS